MSRIDTIHTLPHYDLPLEHAIKSLFMLEYAEGFEDVTEILREKAHQLFMQVPEKDGVRVYRASQGLHFCYLPTGLVSMYTPQTSLRGFVSYSLDSGQEQNAQKTVILKGYQAQQSTLPTELEKAEERIKKEEINFTRRLFEYLKDSSYLPEFWVNQLRGYRKSRFIVNDSDKDFIDLYEKAKTYQAMDQEMVEHLNIGKMLTTYVYALEDLSSSFRVYYSDDDSLKTPYLDEAHLADINQMIEDSPKNYNDAMKTLRKIEAYTAQITSSSYQFPFTVAKLGELRSYYWTHRKTGTDVYVHLASILETFVEAMDHFAAIDDYQIQRVLYHYNLIAEAPKRPSKKGATS